MCLLGVHGVLCMSVLSKNHMPFHRNLTVARIAWDTAKHMKLLHIISTRDTLCIGFHRYPILRNCPVLSFIDACILLECAGKGEISEFYIHSRQMERKPWKWDPLLLQQQYIHSFIDNLKVYFCKNCSINFYSVTLKLFSGKECKAFIGWVIKICRDQEYWLVHAEHKHFALQWIFPFYLSSHWCLGERDLVTLSFNIKRRNVSSVWEKWWEHAATLPLFPNTLFLFFLVLPFGSHELI